jgi:uncharacterized surface protein with fasciclin (FAS1) repeats
MKKIILNPLAIAALVSVTFFSCATSDNMSDSTAMEDSTTMSETQTMGGDTEVDMDTDMGAGVSTDVDANIDYGAMFDNVPNTKQYDIVALAKTNPNLSTFVTLVQAAGLTDILKGDGPYTVFVPTNAAFNQLPQEKREMLMKPENKTELIKVLQLHVLPSKVASTQFKNNQRIEASDNKYINIAVDNTNSVMVGGAHIVKPNVEASNGLIHVIDGVISTSSGAGKY